MFEWALITIYKNRNGHIALKNIPKTFLKYRIQCPVLIFNGEVEEDNLAPELLEIEEEIEMRRRIKQNRTEELKKYRQDMDMGVLRLSRPSSPKDWDQD